VVKPALAVVLTVNLTLVLSPDVIALLTKDLLMLDVLLLVTSQAMLEPWVCEAAGMVNTPVLVFTPKLVGVPLALVQEALAITQPVGMVSFMRIDGPVAGGTDEIIENAGVMNALPVNPTPVVLATPVVLTRFVVSENKKEPPNPPFVIFLIDTGVPKINKQGGVPTSSTLALGEGVVPLGPTIFDGPFVNAAGKVLQSELISVGSLVTLTEKVHVWPLSGGKSTALSTFGAEEPADVEKLNCEAAKQLLMLNAAAGLAKTQPDGKVSVNEFSAHAPAGANNTLHAVLL
jgi:hypothetical protein